MAKELVIDMSAASPDKKNPMTIRLGDFFNDPSPDDILEVWISWEEATWGTKTPWVNVEAKKP